MKKYYSVLFPVMLFMATGCLKKIDIPETNNVQVTFNSSGAKFITNDITVNPKDSIFFDFTISSPRDMKYVNVQKNGTDIIKDTLPESAKNSYSAVKKLAADSMAGVYTYSIVAKDAAGIYLGNKSLVVTVTSDFVYYSFKTLYVPDTTAKTNETYFATSTGQTFSYSTVGGNSGLIDFGFLYDTATANKHTIYALNTTPMPNQVSFYDISSWTKNATIFKRATTPVFSSLTSGGALKSAGITNLASGTASKITVLAAGNVIFFKTAAGKYGALQVNYIEGDSPAKTTYINIDVKVQK